MPLPSEPDLQTIVITGQPLLVSGCAAMLHRRPEFRGCGIRQQPDAHPRDIRSPRLILLLQPTDWPSALQACAIARARHPETLFLAGVPSHPPEPLLQKLLDLEFHGFIPVDADESVWVEAVQQVLTRGSYRARRLIPALESVSAPIPRRVLARIPERALNGRKRQVLELALEGLPPKAIGDRLGLDLRLIRDYLRRLRTTPRVKSALLTLGVSL